jgi:hypothetical protein
MDVIDVLNGISQDFAKRRGRPPASWQELADEKWRGIPVDSSGVPFAFDPATGRISLARESGLWPLPDGSAAAAAGIAPR